MVEKKSKDFFKMANSIQIYLIQEDHSNDRREKIANILSSNNSYNIHIPSIEYNPTVTDCVNSESTSKKSESHYEAYQIGWCLLDSKTLRPKRVPKEVQALFL